MKASRQSWMVVGAGIAFLLLYWAATYWVDQRDIYANPTSYGKGATGLSFFTELKSRARPQSVRINRSPFLRAEALQDIDTVFILAPLSPLSPRETALLLEQVKAGKKLVLSYHDSKTLSLIAPLLPSTDAKLESSFDPDFKDGTLRRVDSEAQGEIVRLGETYEFYSYWVMSTAAGSEAPCALSTTLCYVRELTLGKGKILVFAGIPPFANGLIARADNRHLAFRLVDWSGRALIDEYHHFFSEKTMKDLWMDPSFLLPMLGFLIGALLYFFFAHTELHSRLKRPTEPTVARRSYHSLNREILLSLLGRENTLPGAVEKQTQFLKRLFPQESQRIDEIRLASHALERGEVMKTATRLLLLHQQFLKRKGRQTK